MVRKRTKSERLRDKMPDRETRFERLRDKVSKGEARFRKKNQHLDNYMGIKYSWAQRCYTDDVNKYHKIGI